MTTIPKDRLPNIPMFLANIISEAHARSTIKIHEMTFDIAGVYGQVGPAERYLIPSMVFEVGALEQAGPNMGELTEFRISQQFMDQLKEWGVLVGESSTPAPGSR